MKGLTKLRSDHSWTIHELCVRTLLVELVAFCPKLLLLWTQLGRVLPSRAGQAEKANRFIDRAGVDFIWSRE